MGEGVLVRQCECVTAFFGFWLPRFVGVFGLVNVCTHRCVCVCVCVCAKVCVCVCVCVAPFAAVILDVAVGFGVVWHRL